MLIWYHWYAYTCAWTTVRIHFRQSWNLNSHCSGTTFPHFESHEKFAYATHPLCHWQLCNGVSWTFGSMIQICACFKSESRFRFANLGECCRYLPEISQLDAMRKKKTGVKNEIFNTLSRLLTNAMYYTAVRITTRIPRGSIDTLNRVNKHYQAVVYIRFMVILIFVLIRNETALKNQLRRQHRLSRNDPIILALPQVV